MIFVLLVLLLFIVGYVVITKKKSKSNVPPQSSTPIFDTKVNIPIEEPCTENKIAESPNNAATQIEATDIVKEPVPAITQSSSIITSGENEYYKDLLWDSKWIQKRDNRKRIDHYVCQNCYNTIKLNDINEVSKYVDFPEVADIVISPTVKLEVQLRHRLPPSLERSGKGGGRRWKPGIRVIRQYKIKKGDLCLPRINYFCIVYEV